MAGISVGLESWLATKDGAPGEVNKCSPCLFSLFSETFPGRRCSQAQTSLVTLGRERGMWKGGWTVCFYSPSLWTNRSAVTNTPDPFNDAISQELCSSVGQFETLSHGWHWEQDKCWDYELDAILLTSALCSLLFGKKKKTNLLGIRPNSGFIGKLAEPGRVFLLQMLLASVQQDASVKNTVLTRSIAWHWGLTLQSSWAFQVLTCLLPFASESCTLAVSVPLSFTSLPLWLKKRGVSPVDWALSITRCSQYRNARVDYLFLNVFLDSGFSSQFGEIMPWPGLPLWKPMEWDELAVLGILPSWWPDFCCPLWEQQYSKLRSVSEDCRQLHLSLLVRSYSKNATLPFRITGNTNPLYLFFSYCNSGMSIRELIQTCLWLWFSFHAHLHENILIRWCQQRPLLVKAGKLRWWRRRLKREQRVCILGNSLFQVWWSPVQNLLLYWCWGLFAQPGKYILLPDVDLHQDKHVSGSSCLVSFFQGTQLLVSACWVMSCRARLLGLRSCLHAALFPSAVMLICPLAAL